MEQNNINQLLSENQVRIKDQIQLQLKEQINTSQIRNYITIGNLKINIISGFLMNPNIHLTSWFDRFIELLWSGSYDNSSDDPNKILSFIFDNPSDETKTILFDLLEKKMIRPGIEIENLMRTTISIPPKKLNKSEEKLFKYPGFVTHTFEKMRVYPFYDLPNWKNNVNHYLNNTGTSIQQNEGSQVWSLLYSNPDLLSSDEMVENVKLLMKKRNYSAYDLISNPGMKFITHPRFRSFITKTDIQKLKDGPRTTHRFFSTLYVIDILEKNPELIEWNGLCENPYAIPIIEKNLDKINFESLAKNPNGLHLFEPYLFILL